MYHWEANCIFSRSGEAWAVYRVPRVAYAHLGDAQRRMAARRMLNWLYLRPERFHLLALSKEVVPAEVAAAWTSLRATRAFPGQARAYTEAVQEVLREDRAWAAPLYLLVQLPRGSRGGDMKKKLLGLAGDVVRSVETAFLTGPEVDIPAEVVSDALAMEQQMAPQVQRTLGGQPARPEEIEWLLRRHVTRGLEEPELVLGGRPPVALIPRGQDVRVRAHPVALGLFDAAMEERLSSLVVHHPDGQEVHQALLVLTGAPDDIDQVEWLFGLDELDFPVDVSVKVRTQHPKDALRALDAKRKVVKDQAREFAQGRQDVPIEIEVAESAGLGLEQKLTQGMPLAWTTVVFAVSAQDETELHTRVNALLNRYQPAHFTLARVPGDQRKLWEDFLPATPMLSTWAIPMDPHFLAESMIHGSSELGDPAGMYLGRQANGHPVFYDPARPMRQMNRSGAVGVTGTLGGGKSVLLKDIMTGILLQGGKGLVIDPKGEYHVFRGMPEVAEQTEIVRLTPASGTRINPFRLSADDRRNYAAAIDIAGLLLNLQEAERRESRLLAIQEAVDATMKASQPSLDVFLERLDDLKGDPDREKAAEAGRCVALLQALKKNPWGQILFGREHTRLQDAALVVLSIAGLPLPRGAATTESERIALTLLFTSLVLARERLIEAPRELLKFLVVDEAWAMLGVPAGARLLQEIERMGRSMNTVPIYATQNAKDFADEEIRNNLGLLFAFRAEDLREIRDVLQLVGLDPDDQGLQEQVRGLTSGWCFHRDIEGRAGIMRVEVVPHGNLRIFSTTPQAEEVAG